MRDQNPQCSGKNLELERGPLRDFAVHGHFSLRIGSERPPCRFLGVNLLQAPVVAKGQVKREFQQGRFSGGLERIER